MNNYIDFHKQIARKRAHVKREALTGVAFVGTVAVWFVVLNLLAVGGQPHV